MIRTKSRSRRRRRIAGVESNTYGLPRGENIRRAMRAVFETQRREALALIDPKLAKAGGRLTTKLAAELLVKDQTAGLILGSGDWPPFKLGNLAMSERMVPMISAYWDTAGRTWRAAHDLDPDAWDVRNPHLRGKIESAVLAFCEETNNTTTKTLSDALNLTRQELIHGLFDAGESVLNLTKRVNKIFDLAARWRARRIGQSEASRAVHAAQQTAGEEAGIVAGWEWLLSSDACPLCLQVAKEARRVRAGEAFAVLGYNPHYSTVRHPPLHPHCNCTMIEVLKPEYGGPVDPEWSPTLIQPKGLPEDEDEGDE